MKLKNLTAAVIALALTTATASAATTYHCMGDGTTASMTISVTPTTVFAGGETFAKTNKTDNGTAKNPGHIYETADGIKMTVLRTAGVIDIMDMDGKASATRTAKLKKSEALSLSMDTRGVTYSWLCGRADTN